MSNIFNLFFIDISALTESIYWFSKNRVFYLFTILVGIYNIEEVGCYS